MDFRYAFFPIWRQQTALTTAGVMAVAVGHALVTGEPLRKPDLLLNLAMGLLCGLIVSIPVAICRFSVSAEGLRTFDSWGRWRQIAWADIAAVEPARYLLWPHLRLQVDGQSRGFWLPLQLKDMAGLRTAVIEQAGARHPLAVALPQAAQPARREG
ncbi:hypothetical protein C1O66_16890 [Paucibacter aquatile]|uniref:PH domain-containing protein n=1 Tax=Kinneretia aquatilis TaxID=2070761 RepID=A0A2N8L009_9BURK|nr:hypothetical protein [Paucibacter aquatile]PND39037.1 hypothetical protein C1O66_16890 [Paucibacter aquatile]